MIHANGTKYNPYCHEICLPSISNGSVISLFISDGDSSHSAILLNNKNRKVSIETLILNKYDL